MLMLSPRLLSVLPLLLWSSPAFADAASSAAAEALFNQARELKEQGNYAEACPKLAESQRLDPGTGTLLNLADCYEKANQLASAWATWIDAARSARAAGQTEREEYAKNKAAELEPALGHISLQVDESAPEGLQIKKDGEIVARAIWGTPLPADARSYRIEASAPGYESFVVEVTVEDGQTTNVIIPALTASAPPPLEDRPAPAPAPGSALRTTGWVVAGTGVAGLAAGSILGILAMSKNGASKEHCDPSDPNLCQQPGIDLRNEALGFGDAATVAFIAGGVLTVGGLVIVLAAPKKTEQVTFTPTLGGGFLTYRGSF
ncbi:MAG: hypothetical protein B6A08_01470 [Sorangiineae bacterium NIC37A_2]|nr:MAG: hypothetical protein B6A08_01470 [Sorangiineae bacterium NIC37A_2]